MDPWDHIRRAARDERSGSAAIASRAAAGFAGLHTRADLMRATRTLVRAHPSMAALRRLAAACLDDDPARAAGHFIAALLANTDAAADGARWIVTKRGSIILTHSSSSGVARALARVRARVARVVCTASLPGGEGRAFARRLARDGFDTEVIADAEIGAACLQADVALVGADAITEDGVVNKVGTRLVALAARDVGIGCYAIACAEKLIPSRALRIATPFEETPLELFDAVLTERGAQRPAAIQRAITRVRIPKAIASL